MVNAGAVKSFAVSPSQKKSTAAKQNLPHAF